MNNLPKYRGEPSMANGDETALSVWDMSTPEGREAAQVFYDLQDALHSIHGHVRPPAENWCSACRSLEASEAIHELSVNATSDRSYMTPEGFEAAIRDVRAEAWHQGWVASEAYTGRSAFPVNPYEDQVCGWVPAGPFCDLEPGHDGPHG